jgi:mannose-1-phosphate guanylyltransferase
MSPQIFPVIMAGGSGTRFWPLSRSNKPKQFLELTSDKTLIAETLARARTFSGLENCLIVCGARHAALVKKSLPKLRTKNILIEPAARNTAPAIALAALHVAKRNPEGVLVVLPSDQHVSNLSAFAAAIDEAVSIADTGMIVTLGITPTRPETGYGYIKQGAKLSGQTKRVAAFVEKPDVSTAKKYVSSKQYLWNAGIFVFRADVMLEAFSAHLPQSNEPLENIFESLGTNKAATVLAREFNNIPANSIDYAIAEKAENMAVVPCDCGWSDVGSFNALSEVRAMDANGNVSDSASHVVIDSRDCVVVGNQKLIALVGMNDVVVVDTPDALLVMPKDRSQDVKKVIEALKANKKWTALL